MIKINLLRVREEKRKESYRFQLIVAGVALGLLLLMIGIIHIRMNQKINRVKNDINNVQAEIKKFEQEVGRVEDFKKKKDDLEKKVQAIESLEKGRELPARIMVALAEAIPVQAGATVPKRVQLTSLKITGANMELKGLALNEESLAFFMKNLEGSDLFSNVLLDSTTLVEKGGAKFNEFSIRVGIVASAQPVSPPLDRKGPPAMPGAKR